MKIFDYSEYHNREQYLRWDLLLAPQHCSKRVMYKPDGDGRDVLRMDMLNAFERNGRDRAVIVSGGAVSHQRMWLGRIRHIGKLLTGTARSLMKLSAPCRGSTRPRPHRWSSVSTEPARVLSESRSSDCPQERRS